MRRVVLALAMVALPACGMLSSGGSGGGGSGGGGSGGGGGGSTSSDEHVQHNVDMLNMYRAQNGVAALTLDDSLSTFSTTASNMLESSGMAHGYFMAQAGSGALWQQGFCNSAAENQAPGWPVNGDEDATVDAILKAMMDEGPGGGHHDNILAASSTRVGVGLVVDANQALWFTNDFSGACQ
jgi:uncharacterized protein YkwD